MNTFERWRLALHTLEKLKADEASHGGEANYNWKVDHRLRLEAAIKDELHWRKKVDRLLTLRSGGRTNT